ncbi:MAG: polyprenyl synthetase family protein [Kiritimatiellales bacterium]|nr:polyprenyl synthetase family protein [Kiritimatiellota bacterium]MBL7011904.1 polyprenyl synthetase family protein [Kiritimatiellales bacterium]
MNDLKQNLLQTAETVNQALERILPGETVHPERLHQAMRYSVFAGGKRLRPALCIAACEACGGTAAQAMDAACALELLHTYTLIHDDLPAMDDDTLRRGQPTCHIEFDEATAILAGDALLTLAFEVLAGVPHIGCQLALELAKASGSRGVIGGQAEDLAAEGQPADADLLEYIHRHKTAALIRTACVMGGLCAGANSQILESLAVYGENTGLAFQLIDDLLDESSTEAELGKNIGSDKEKDKMTWPAVHGVEASRERVHELTESACEAANNLPDGKTLNALASFMASRQF